jgi:hypothetical protein
MPNTINNVIMSGKMDVLINDGGVLIFHDVGNGQTGVKKCWDEVKGNAVRIQEFIKTSTCGIGIYFKQ